MTSEYWTYAIVIIGLVVSFSYIFSQLSVWWGNRLVKAPSCCICGNTDWKWTRDKSKSGSSPLCSDRCYGAAFQY